jgi:hypothetical protein
VVVELLLLLLWSGKEPNTCCTVDEDIDARRNIGNCSLSLSPSASQVNLNAIPSGASEVDPNAISLPPVPMHLLVGERIPKELLPLFLCVTSRDCRKTSCQMVNSDHIEARMRESILHRLYPASRFDWDDITVIKSGQDFSRNKTHVLLEEGST